MRIVFAGTPEFAVPSLHALIAAGHDIVGVLTRADAPIGRKRILTPSPVALAAIDLGLPIHRSNMLDADATAWVQSHDPELGVIVAYGGLLREPLLSSPERGWINLHFSDLPRWRGAAPVQRALEAGEQQLGVTVFRLVPALDAGAVLTRDSFDFAIGTSAGEALQTLSNTGTDALVRAVQLLSSNPEAGEAQRGEASYAHKLSREDGKLDVAQSFEKVLAQWAGMTPEPGAFVLHGDKPLKVLSLALPSAEALSEIAKQQLSMPIGTLFVSQGQAYLAARNGFLEVQQVQPSGKAAMDGAAWLRGRGGEALVA